MGMVTWAWSHGSGHMGVVTWGFTDHFFTDPFPEKWLLAWQCERKGARGKYGRPGSDGKEGNLGETGLEKGGS